MTAVYEKHDVRFMYPENWRLSEDNDGRVPWEISLETPEGGLWSVSIFPAETDPQDLIKKSVEALKQQYEDVEVNELTTDFSGFQSTGFDAYFYCLDFLVTAQIRVIQAERYTYVFYDQAESREFDNNSQVFQAIATSLLENEQ